MEKYVECCEDIKIVKGFGIVFKDECYKMNVKTSEITSNMQLAAEWNETVTIDFDDIDKWVMVAKMIEIRNAITERKEVKKNERIHIFYGNRN